jgi:hypothetical protein
VTGTLTGKPTSANVGTSAPITIKAPRAGWRKPAVHRDGQGCFEHHSVHSSRSGTPPVASK